MNKFSRVALLAFLALSSNAAWAGRDVIIDDPSNYPNNYTNSGYGVKTKTSGGTTATITFPLNFGVGGAIGNRVVTINPNGQMTFNATGDSFAPILLPAGFSFLPQSNIAFQTGYLAPDIIDSAYSSASRGVPATDGLQFDEFLFNNVCASTTSTCSGNGFSFDALLIRLDDNTFVLRFDYNQFNPAPPVGSVGQYSIGTNSTTFALPNNATGSDSASGVDFCFHNGVESAFSNIATCRQVTTASVPEPQTWLLIGIGGLLMLGAARRMPKATSMAQA